MEETPEEFFEISAVARLTGISPHVLRVWERRYRVVDPRRSDSQRRQYTQSDIQRLALLKTLVDSGHAIGSIASLTTGQLEERLSHVVDSRASSDAFQESVPAGACRIGLVGIMIRQAVREAADSTPGLRIAGEFNEIDELLAGLRMGAADILIIERDTIFPEDIEVIQDALGEMGVRRAILIYRFAQEETILPLDLKRITALRAPVDAAEIRLACIADIQLALRSGEPEEESGRPAGETRIEHGDEQGLPERAFTDEQLVRIAGISSVVKCECPQHLASLLSSLFAFEKYCEQCESRNAEDAALHRFLHRTTAQCRSQMEAALSEVLEQEGITG